MAKNVGEICGLVLCWVVAAVVGVSAGEREPERERLESLCRQAQPAVAEISGFPAGEPVPVEVRSRAEIRQYLESMLDVEYPNRELDRRSRCFGEIGLLPRNCDLARGLIEFLDEQAGGFMTPTPRSFCRSGTFRNRSAPIPTSG